MAGIYCNLVVIYGCHCACTLKINTTKSTQGITNFKNKTFSRTRTRIHLKYLEETVLFFCSFITRHILCNTHFYLVTHFCVHCGLWVFYLQSPPERPKISWRNPHSLSLIYHTWEFGASVTARWNGPLLFMSSGLCEEASSKAWLDVLAQRVHQSFRLAFFFLKVTKNYPVIIV